MPFETRLESRLNLIKKLHKQHQSAKLQTYDAKSGADRLPDYGPVSADTKRWDKVVAPEPDFKSKPAQPTHIGKTTDLQDRDKFRYRGKRNNMEANLDVILNALTTALKTPLTTLSDKDIEEL